MAVLLPSFKTDATDALCREIAKKSRGVCFLGFSRGKDSLCAWLSLKRYFKRIIPFHSASVPMLRFTEDALRHYEDMMETHILRMVSAEMRLALSRLQYQVPGDDFDEMLEIDDEKFTILDMVEGLRKAYNLPRAWCAFGISQSDSIDRRIYCQKVGGKNPQNLSFYPCYDWPRAEIVDAVRQSGIRLSSEYRFTNRTLVGIPSTTMNGILKKHYPEDWERFLAIYPLAEAKTLRERYLDRAYAERRALGVVADSEGADAYEGDIPGAPPSMDAEGEA